MKLPDQLVELAKEHIFPVPDDEAAFRSALEAAVAACERHVGVSLMGGVKEARIAFERRSEAFYTQHAVMFRGEKILLGHDYSGYVDLSVESVKGRRPIGRAIAVKGEVAIHPDRIPELCGCGEVVIVAQWREQCARWPWDGILVQGILRLAKFLYEHRGDATSPNPGGNSDPVHASGASQLWGMMHEHV